MGLSLGVGAEDTRWGWNRGLSLGLEKHQHCIDFPLAAGLQQCCTCILYIFVTWNAVGRIKKLKNYTVKFRITVYRHSAYRILPIYVNILKFSNYITGFFPTSRNAAGLISTFAGLALLFCIKTSSIIHHPRTEPKRKRVPRRKIAKPQLTSDTHIKFKKHYRHP